VQSHANDLRAEVLQDWRILVDAAALDTTSVSRAAAGASPSEHDCDALVHQIVDDWHQAPLRESVAQLLAYAERVSLTPAQCTAADIADLRAVGWSDVAIHDAVQVTAYFNYINRIADAFGVEAEQGFPHWGQPSSA